VIVVTSGAFVVKLVRGLHSDKNVDIMKLFSSLLIYLACERRYISGCYLSPPKMASASLSRETISVM